MRQKQPVLKKNDRMTRREKQGGKEKSDMIGEIKRVRKRKRYRDEHRKREERLKNYTYTTHTLRYLSITSMT